MKKSLVTVILLLLLPAGLKGLSTGLSTLQKSAGPGADLEKLHSSLAEARATVSTGDDPAEVTVRKRYTIPRLEDEIQAEKWRREWAEKRPAGYAWTAVGGLLVICWCIAMHLLLAGLKTSRKSSGH